MELFVFISIHRPHPEKEKLVVNSMHRYGDAAQRQKGLVNFHSEGREHRSVVRSSNMGFLGLLLRRETSTDQIDGG